MDDMKLARGILIGVIVSMCVAWTYTWDCATPVGTDAPSVIDDRIRQVKYAVAERFNVDHYAPLTGTQVSDTAAGQHRQVEFYGPITTPTNATDKGFLYTKDVSDKAELHFEDEDGNEIQLTTGGIINSANLSGDQTIAGTKTFSSAIVSTVTTGTAPLTVASTTKVTNLNADKWENMHLQYGTGSSTQDTTQTFTFSESFDITCVMVVITRNEGDATYVLPVTGRSKTGFTINRNDEIENTVTFNYIAIGY
jgi:hypothetical protein